MTFTAPEQVCALTVSDDRTFRMVLFDLTIDPPVPVKVPIPPAARWGQVRPVGGTADGDLLVWETWEPVPHGYVVSYARDGRQRWRTPVRGDLRFLITAQDRPLAACLVDGGWNEGRTLMTIDTRSGRVLDSATVAWGKDEVP